MMSAFDIAVAARTIWAEARSEDHQTRVGVAWVLRTRHESYKWYSGRTVAECCALHAHGSAYGQFSCWNVDDPNYALMFRVSETDPLLTECAAALQEAFASGYDQDPTQGATHYVNLDISHPSWVDMATKTAKLGKLTFFKNVH